MFLKALLHSLVTTPMISLMLLTAWSAQAGQLPSYNPDDYDVAKYQAIERQAEVRAAQARGQLQEANRRLNEAQSRLEQASRGINEARAQYEAARQRAANAREQIPQTEARVQQLRSQIPALESRKQQLEVEAQQLQQEYQSAKMAFAQADRRADELERDAMNNPALRPKAQAARAQAEGLRAVVQRAEQALSRNAQNLSATTQQLSQARVQLAQEEQNLNRARAVLADATREAQMLADRVLQLQNQLPPLSQAVQAASGDRDRAITLFQALERDHQLAEGRLRQVQQNLQTGVAIAAQDGREAGRVEGYREGTQNGAYRGNQEGRTRGEREGFAQGEREAIAQAQAAGTQAGQLNGSREGQERGLNEGLARGRSEGQERGRNEGLAAGYEAGRREGDAQGYPDGQTAGHAQGGFAKGRAEGFAAGRDRARQEGDSKGYRDGYAEGEKRFLDADLREETISMTYDHGNVGGGMSRATPAFPHPALREAYEREYREEFQRAAARGYEAAYQETFRRAYDQSYALAFQQARMIPHPAEYEFAYQRSYRESYGQSYRIAYDPAYRSSYDQSYREAYAQALPVRRSEGFRDGRAAGFERGRAEAYAADFQQGRAEGDATGYQETYPVAFQAAKTRGNQEADRFYSTHAVLDFEGASLVEANEDGVYAPGEVVRFSLRIKNYGKVAQAASGVELRLNGNPAGIEISDLTAGLPALPAQSAIRIQGILPFRVASTAEIGRPVNLSYLLAKGADSLGTGDLSLSPGFPYGIIQVAAPAIVSPNEAVALPVQIRNVSAKASQSVVTVRLVSLDQLAQPVGAPASIGKLAPTEQKTAQLSFQFPESSAFRKLRFQVEVLEGDWVLGKRLVEIDATRRWTYHPESQLLLVVGSGNNARRAEQAAAAAGLAVDLWDVRAEGQLTTEAALKYATSGQIIVFPTLDAGLDATTARTISEVLEKDGSVYADVSAGYASHPVGAVLDSFLSRHARPGFGSLGQVGQGNFFARSGDRALVVLGASPGAGEPVAQFGERLASTRLLSLPMEAKVVAYRSLVTAGNLGPALENVRNAILRDLIQEMQDDKAIDGDHFKKDVPNLRLTRFINLALAAQGNERRGLLSFFPALNESRKDIGWLLSSRRLAIRKVMKPLKKAYEAEIDR